MEKAQDDDDDDDRKYGNRTHLQQNQQPHRSSHYPPSRPEESRTDVQLRSSSTSCERLAPRSSAQPPPADLLYPQLYEDNNPEPPRLKCPPLPPEFRNGCQDVWQWNRHDKSHEVRLCGLYTDTAFFHPNWSNGTAGVRGTRPINQGVHYWEIRVSSRLFGTSMMFGVATRRARLHADSFLNLLGEDEHSWGLSHKGLLWHRGSYRVFCSPFAENIAVTVGMVYDGTQGTLAYFKDGESLGVAFTGLNAVKDELFPAICSTAAKTEMTLGVTRRAFVSLQDRCRDSIVKKLMEVRAVGDVARLPLPRVLCHYVSQEVQAAVAVP